VSSVRTPSEVDAIRRRMAVIRRELRDDVQEVVAGAETVVDWRHYVKRYPWAALGLACAAGYLIVPKHRKVIVDTAEVASKIRKDSEAERKVGILASGVGLVAPILFRFGLNYAAKLAENWILQRQFDQPPNHQNAQDAPATTAGTRRRAPGGQEDQSR